MINVSIPSNGPSKISFSSFMNYLLPIPPKGIISAGNDEAILLFDNKEEAKLYAEKLKQLPGSQKKAGNEIVAAIMRLLR